MPKISHVDLVGAGKLSDAQQEVVRCPMGLRTSTAGKKLAKKVHCFFGAQCPWGSECLTASSGSRIQLL